MIFVVFAFVDILLCSYYVFQSYSGALMRIYYWKFEGLDETDRGPNFWKFNSNLVNDSDYCELLTTVYVNWLEEFKDVQDKHVLWDLIKYKLRQRTITYSKGKARERRAKL